MAIKYDELVQLELKCEHESTKAFFKYLLCLYHKISPKSSTPKTNYVSKWTSLSFQIYSISININFLGDP